MFYLWQRPQRWRDTQNTGGPVALSRHRPTGFFMPSGIGRLLL